MRIRAFTRRLLFMLALALGACLLGAVLGQNASAGTYYHSTVTGTVTDTAGSPVAGSNVYVLAEASGGNGWVLAIAEGLTGPDGRYSISFDWFSDDYTGQFSTDYGAYSMGTWREQLYGGWQVILSVPYFDQVVQHATRFSLADGETKTLDTVRLKKYYATIKGRVTSAATGGPLKEVSVVAYMRQTDATAGWAPADPVYTDAAGMYSVDVPPCIDKVLDYVVLFSKSDGLWQPDFFVRQAAQPEWQGLLFVGLADQAMAPELRSIKIDSEQTFTANAALRPPIKEKLTVDTVARVRARQQFSVDAGLVAGHTNAPAVKIRFSKYVPATRSWRLMTPQPANLWAKHPGSVSYRLTTGLRDPGLYRVWATVGKHWLDESGQPAPGHGARRSARVLLRVDPR